MDLRIPALICIAAACDRASAPSEHRPPTPPAPAARPLSPLERDVLAYETKRVEGEWSWFMEAPIYRGAAGETMQLSTTSWEGRYGHLLVGKDVWVLEKSPSEPTVKVDFFPHCVINCYTVAITKCQPCDLDAAASRMTLEIPRSPLGDPPWPLDVSRTTADEVPLAALVHLYLTRLDLDHVPDRHMVEDATGIRMSLHRRLFTTEHPAVDRQRLDCRLHATYDTTVRIEKRAPRRISVRTENVTADFVECCVRQVTFVDRGPRIKRCVRYTVDTPPIAQP